MRRTVAIVGSRTYPAPWLVQRYVAALDPATIVISGGARGVDTIAEQAARARGLEVIVLRPDFEHGGKYAPLVRNSQLVARADALVAFWDGQSRGTMDAVRKARRKGIPVHVYGPEEGG